MKDQFNYLFFLFASAIYITQTSLISAKHDKQAQTINIRVLNINILSVYSVFLKCKLNKYVVLFTFWTEMKE